jgi:hypothetical protein
MSYAVILSIGYTYAESPVASTVCTRLMTIVLQREACRARRMSGPRAIPSICAPPATAQSCGRLHQCNAASTKLDVAGIGNQAGYDDMKSIYSALPVDSS